MYDNAHQQTKRYAEIATQAIMNSLGYKMGDVNRPGNPGD